MVSAVALVVVPGASACQLPDVTGCTPEPEPAPEPPAPEPPAPAPPSEPELPAEPPAVIPPDTDAAEARLLVLINDDRRANGLREVSARADVEEIADGHSAAMATGHDIWHNDAYFTAATKRRLGASRVGENVALNRSADDAHQKLMASPLHRANILDAGFSVVGIAVAADENGRLYITEDFLEPVRPAASAPAKGTAIRMRAPAPRAEAPPVPQDGAAPPAAEDQASLGEGFELELALGAGASIPPPGEPGRPWPAYLLASALLLGVAVGVWKVAC